MKRTLSLIVFSILCQLVALPQMANRCLGGQGQNKKQRHYSMKYLHLRCLLIAIFSWMPITLLAQLPHDIRSEQIFLCPDRATYEAGDTIMLQGVVTCNSAKNLYPHSRYVNVEFTTSDSIITHIEATIDSTGYFSTILPIDLDIKNGKYYLRGYTELMRNFSQECFAFQPIRILANRYTTKPSNDTQIFSKIVPWGGFLTSGTVQRITVWLHDHEGNAVAGRQISLNDNSGLCIDTQTSSANGLVTISFVPKPREKYAITLDDGSLLDFVEAYDTAPKIECSLNNKKVSYTITNKNHAPKGYQIYGYDCQNGPTRINSEFSNGSFALARKPHLFTIFLTDSLHNVISECSAINAPHTECQVNATATAHIGDTIHINAINLPRNSTIIARLVSANDASCLQDATSAIDLTSQLTSELPLPKIIFNQNNADILAWLGTAKFSRFKIGDAIRNDTAFYTRRPKLQMSASGIASLKSGYSLKGGSLVAYNTAHNLVTSTKFSHDGNFEIPLDNFFGNTRFFFQAIDFNGIPRNATFDFPEKDYPSINIPKRYVSCTNELQTPLHSHAISLPDITVKGYISKTDNIPSNEIYATTYKSREEIERRNYQTLYDILRNIPGLIVTNSGIYSTRGSSTLEGSSSVSVMVDNTLHTYDKDYGFGSLMNMPSQEIESVEYMKPWKALAYTSSAFNGLIMIYTRDSHQKPKQSRGTYVTLQGLTPIVAPRRPVVHTMGDNTLIIDILSPDVCLTLHKKVTVIE